MAEFMTRHFGGVSKEWAIYSVEEAENEGIEYVHWKIARKGDWALTDDGFVCEVVRSKKFKPKGNKSSRYELTFPFVRCFSTQRRLEYEEFQNMTTPVWLREEMQKGRTKRVVKLFAKAMLEHGRFLPEDVLKGIAVQYRPDVANPTAQFLRLLKRPEVWTMIHEDVSRLLSTSGLDPEKILDMYKESFEVAKETKNAAAMRAVAKDLADMAGMKHSKQTDDKLLPQGELVNWEELDAEIERKELDE